MSTIRIKVVSDVVCPWCYIGRKKLQMATKLWSEHNPSSSEKFAIDYEPYQLNPHFPKGPASSTDKRQYYVDKFGDPDRIFNRVRDAGAAVGIKFNFGGKTGNTRDPHRLVQLAKGYGEDVQVKTMDALFAAYHEQEKDITSYEVLKEVAVAAGIPADAFQKGIVESDECGEAVDKAVNEARMNGVTGVPDYTIQDRVRVSGARDPMDFIRAFEMVKNLN